MTVGPSFKPNPGVIHIVFNLRFKKFLEVHCVLMFSGGRVGGSI